MAARACTARGPRELDAIGVGVSVKEGRAWCIGGEAWSSGYSSRTYAERHQRAFSRSRSGQSLGQRHTPGVADIVVAWSNVSEGIRACNEGRCGPGVSGSAGHEFGDHRPATKKKLNK